MSWWAGRLSRIGACWRFDARSSAACADATRRLRRTSFLTWKGVSGARAVVGVPAAALRVNKQQLRNALRGIVDLLMIVSEPFAVAYGLEALVNSLIIDIGAGTCDFCVMNGRYPSEEDQRTLTLGSYSFNLRRQLRFVRPDVVHSSNRLHQ